VGLRGSWLKGGRGGGVEGRYGWVDLGWWWREVDTVGVRGG
jgi:hypothetical protein